jgi:pseudaminic acid cytidylyltransferase
MKTGGRICIIPARGGSKRIPRKNIRLFAGKPIIAHPIEAALDSGCYDEVMVSTDDEEIAEVARAHGAKVPFLRSPATSGDFAGTLEVLTEVLQRYRTEGQREFDLGCLIYATAALTTAERLREGLERILADESLTYVLSLIPFGAPVQRAVYMQDGRVHMFQPEHYNSRSQDLIKGYKDAGQWHWFRTGRIHEMKPVLGPTAGAVILTEMEAQDIDDEEEWRLAEFKYRMRHYLR